LAGIKSNRSSCCMHYCRLRAPHAAGSWPRTCGSQQKLSVHVPLGQAVDCLLASADQPAPQVCPEHKEGGAGTEGCSQQNASVHEPLGQAAA